MFIDEAKITVKAGDGGKGSVSFRREKFIPRGGPDGGDAGKGGDVIFVASRGESTLLRFRYTRRFDAESGGNGEGRNCHGKNGADLHVAVPCGTQIKNIETGETLCDLTDDGQEFVAVRGGIGGRGNAFFKSSTMQAPRFAQPGLPGESLELLLELKLLADVGLVGLPNAGKSTLISRLTAAHPKIADYPFTTLSPKLGVVQVELDSFVIADMPGLIEGAHLGKGLGDRFLKHIERTAVLCHLVDICMADLETIRHDFDVIEKELESFNPDLIKKRQFVLLTKIDAVSEPEKIEAAEREFKDRGFTVLAISSVSGHNLDLLVRRLHEAVQAVREN